MLNSLDYRLENEPRTKFEPFVDDMMADDILAQIQNAALKARTKLSGRKNASKMGFIQQRHDGTTSMQILVGADNTFSERIVSLGALIGKLKDGSGQLHTSQEDRRNRAKAVIPLNYGTFCSFAPVYDSRFANLSKEETELVLTTYGNKHLITPHYGKQELLIFCYFSGNESGADYAASIIEFTKNSRSGNALANNLLDCLTDGEHRRTLDVLMNNSRNKFDQQQLEIRYPNPPTDNENEKYKNMPIDFNGLRSLGALGVNMEFLGEMEEEYQMFEICRSIQGRLENNSELTEELDRVQNDRLSQHLPVHLEHIPNPNVEEIELADQTTSNLTQIGKELAPHVLTTPHELGQTIGMTNGIILSIMPIRTTPGDSAISNFWFS